MKEFKPNIIDGEPLCSSKCPLYFNGTQTCMDEIYLLHCIPGLLRQRDDFKAETDETEHDETTRGVGAVGCLHCQDKDKELEQMEEEAERLRALIPHVGARIAMNRWYDAIREPVRWFAEQMEKKLHANDGKGGWDSLECSISYLHERLDEEMEELHEASFIGGDLEYNPDVVEECVDIANFAMMIADRHRAIKEKQDGKTSKS